MAVLRGAGVESGSEVAPVQSRAQLEEAPGFRRDLSGAPPPLGGGGFCGGCRLDFFVWVKLADLPAGGLGGASPMNDDDWMREALAEARRAADLGEVPVGAVVVLEGRAIGRGHNRREIDRDPLAHAELLALAEAARVIGGWRLSGATLYATLEPCAMCAGALVNSRVDRLVFGAADPKAGWCGSLGDLVRDPRLNHRLEVASGVLEAECGEVLREFFAALRAGPAVL